MYLKNLIVAIVFSFYDKLKHIAQISQNRVYPEKITIYFMNTVIMFFYKLVQFIRIYWLYTCSTEIKLQPVNIEPKYKIAKDR